MTKKVELPVLLIDEFNKLTLGPKRNRHKLHTPTTCPLCFTKLKWQHMLKRHQRTEKCQMIQITLDRFSKVKVFNFPTSTKC